VRNVQRRRTDVPHVVDHTDRDSRWDDLVDPVEDVDGQFDPVRGEVALEVFHGPRTDDGGGDGGVSNGKGHRHHGR
jgi:hypothetical protein